MNKLLLFGLRLNHKSLFLGRVPVCAYSTETSNKIFNGAKDRYNGITIDSKKEMFNEKKFTENLDDSLSKWSLQGYRCVWFKVNIQDAFCVPILAQKGFNFHHARDDFVMMYKWLPGDSMPNLPPSCHTNLGVGAMVFNDTGHLLAISEKHYEYPHWKLPGGYVERGEDIIDAAVREVKEETGVDATFESLVTFRHTHNMMFDNSDIYVILMMKALTDKITLSQREVNLCKWMKVEEYLSHQHVHKFNKFIVHTALEYKKRNLKLDLKKRTVIWPTHVRDTNFLIVEDFK
ncbi:hypothetical protein SFRURICE_004060 [Spodoptera frugiperda]|uniref:SFRICE_012832 n=1 Tax=Spodoptera frugiperda TaxID=7108 RepID=A0A2H1WQU9_SPOFR|nr:hypothetical protein SFRURICE_004060 [Spodoptera frugiperda]